MHNKYIYLSKYLLVTQPRCQDYSFDLSRVSHTIQERCDMLMLMKILNIEHNSVATAGHNIMIFYPKMIYTYTFFG